MDLDKVEDDMLICNFVREATKQRGSYIDALMKKYVKNQDDSDLIDLRTLEVVKNRGHVNKIKCIPFSYLSRYSCKTGIKSLRILKKRIEIRKKYNVAENGNEEQSTIVSAIEKSFSILDCRVELTRLPSSYFINELPKSRRLKFSDQSSKKQILKRLSNLNYDFDLLSYTKSMHLPNMILPIRPTICDLSLTKFSGVHQNNPPISNRRSKMVKFWNNLDLIDTLKPQYVNQHKNGTINARFRKRDTQDICMEIEEIDITDNNDNIFEIHKTNISEAVYTSSQPKFKLNSSTFSKHTEVNERSKTVLCANLSVKNATHCSEKSPSTFKLHSSNVNKHAEVNDKMNKTLPCTKLSLKNAMHCSEKSPSTFKLHSSNVNKHAEVNEKMNKTLPCTKLSLKNAMHCSEKSPSSLLHSSNVNKYTEDNRNMNKTVPSANLSLKNAIHCSGKSSSNFKLKSPLFKEHAEVNAQMNKTVSYDRLSLKSVPHCSEKSSTNFNLNSLIFNKHTEVNRQMNKTVTYESLSLKNVSRSEKTPSNASSKRAIQTLPCSPVPNYPSNYNVKPVKFAIPTKSSEKNDEYKFSTVIPSSYSSPNYDFKLQSRLYLTKS